mmetsp:Transcript_23512/g.42031  ORF Transcript_23512/g.42031 Transcript_23512/m.42031 type:complete len:254 (-) Transcript_23512:566-1327(-)
MLHVVPPTPRTSSSTCWRAVLPQCRPLPLPVEALPPQQRKTKLSPGPSSAATSTWRSRRLSLQARPGVGSALLRIEPLLRICHPRKPSPWRQRKWKTATQLPASWLAALQQLRGSPLRCGPLRAPSSPFVVPAPLDGAARLAAPKLGLSHWLLRQRHSQTQWQQWRRQQRFVQLPLLTFEASAPHQQSRWSISAEVRPVLLGGFPPALATGRYLPPLLVAFLWPLLAHHPALLRCPASPLFPTASARSQHSLL